MVEYHRQCSIHDHHYHMAHGDGMTIDLRSKLDILFIVYETIEYMYTL